MRIRTKRAWTLMISVMFTLSISYFAVLSPTTAWFYTQKENEYSFIFGDVNLDLPVNETISEVVRLKAATRCADFGEVNFDAAVYVVEVEAINTGTAAARVYINPTLPSGKTKDGLYFFATAHKSTEEDLPTIKSELESYLTSKGVTGMSFGDNGYQAYEDALFAQGGAVEDYQSNGYVVVSPKSTTTIRIAFWVEYNATVNSSNIGTSFENTSTITEFSNFGINIKLTATQDSTDSLTPPQQAS